MLARSTKLTPNEQDLVSLPTISSPCTNFSRVSKIKLRKLARVKSFRRRWLPNKQQQVKQVKLRSTKRSPPHLAIPQLRECARLIDQRNADHSASLGFCRRIQKSARPSLKSNASFRRKSRLKIKSFRRSIRRLNALYSIVYFKQRLKGELQIRGVRAGIFSNFDHPDYKFKRMYLDVYINGVKTEGQLDSAADVNIISLPLLEKILPEWRKLPSAGRIKLTSASNNPIQIVATRWLPFSMSAFDTGSPAVKFAIVQNSGYLLLSSELIYSMKLCLNWNSSNYTPLLSWRRKGRLYTVPVYRSSRYTIAKNAAKVVFAPHEHKCIQLELPESSQFDTCEVSNCLDHSEGNSKAEELVILPTHSSVKGGIIQAVVLNCSKNVVSLPARSLKAKVLLENAGTSDNFTAEDIVSKPEIVSELLDREDVQIDQFPISNLSNEVLNVYAQQRYDDIVDTAACSTGRCLSVSALAATSMKEEKGESKHKSAYHNSGTIPTQAEREEKIKRLYNKESDTADFGRDYGEELGYVAPQPSFQPLEQFDITSVKPEYRPFVRCLLAKYDHAMSRHPYDIGDTSKTLGYLTIPLIKELPKACNKVYTLQGNKRDVMKSILLQMIKYRMIERSTTDRLACPCFIIGKKDPNSAPRFLIDSTQINQYLATAHQILPKIQPLLQEIGSIKPKLLSSVDISSAYHSIRLCNRTSKSIHVSTEFGTYRALVALQGIASVPGLYSGYMQTALHSDPDHDMIPDPLQNVHSFLDDVLIASSSSNMDLDLHAALQKEVNSFEHADDLKDPNRTALTDEQLRDAYSHFLLLDSVMYRIAFHGFKLAPKKLSLFQESAVILGHILNSKGLSVDPSRIEKMVNAPLPENRTQMQKYLGFLSSVKYFSPPELSEQHAILAPLTSTQVDFKLTDTHRKAFDESKRILTSQPFYLDFPDYEACKVLYTDASDILLSGVLMDVSFPDLHTENVPVNQNLPNAIHFDVHQTDHLLTNSDLLHKHKLMPLAVKSKPESSFFESVVHLTQTLGMHNVPTNHKYLRNSVFGHINNSALKQEFNSFFVKRGSSWHDFSEKFHAANTGIDREQFLIAATARYLDREIVVLTINHNKVNFRIHKASAKARNKPVIWVFMEDNGRKSQFCPLAQYDKNHVSNYTSFSPVHYDLPFTKKEDITNMIKNFMISPRKAKPPLECRVIGYFSQVIPTIDRTKAIWLKESQALINSLYKFKSLLEIAPVVVSFCDSSVVYLLCQRAITESCLKIRRTAAMLKLEYPNLIVTGLPGKDNVSDYLSRIMTLPSVVLNSIQSKQIVIGNCSELDYRPLSIPEAEMFVENMPQKHVFLEKVGSSKKEAAEVDENNKSMSTHPSILLAVDDRLDVQPAKEEDQLGLAEKTLLDTIKPVRILGSRLELSEVITAQQNWLCSKEGQNEPDKIFQDKNFCLDPHTNLYRYKGTVFLPPLLEGTALSYYHLISGHIGQKKLYKLLRSRFFFENMEEKCAVFCTACHACAIVNPDRRGKFESGSVPIPNSSWETISMDFLEVAKNSVGIKAILVITDHFSKAIYTFMMKSMAAAPVIERVRDFLMFTGCATRYVLTDNGSPFSGSEFNKFLYVMGIYKIKSTPYLSRARGQVESCNRIITVLLKKLLLLSPRYNYKDILFLAPVLYNSGVNLQTKMIPYEIIFGRVPLHSGPLSGKVREPPKLFSDTVREELKKLRKAISERVETTREMLKENQDRYLKRINKTRRTMPNIKSGDICFIKNYSNIDTGEKMKLRPRLYKSPFVVITPQKRSVVVMRLADGFVTSRHPDDLLIYSDKTKDSPLLADMDSEVWEILGSKLDKNKLENLAKTDQLPLIYTDHILEKPTRVTTRSLSKQKKALENAYIEYEGASDEDSLDDAVLQEVPKQVRFDLPGFQADTAS